MSRIVPLFLGIIKRWRLLNQSVYVLLIIFSQKRFWIFLETKLEAGVLSQLKHLAGARVSLSKLSLLYLRLLFGLPGSTHLPVIWPINLAVVSAFCETTGSICRRIFAVVWRPFDVVALTAADPDVLSLCDAVVSGLADDREAVSRLEHSHCCVFNCVLHVVECKQFWIFLSLAHLDDVVSGAPSFKMNVEPSGAVLDTITGSPVSSVKWTFVAVTPSSTFAPWMMSWAGVPTKTFMVTFLLSLLKK